MANLPKISFLFRATFIPTGAVYYGVHDSTDISFGTNMSRDPYMGEGAKLEALAKTNPRRAFRVDTVRIGTRAEVELQLRKILDGLDYSNPSVLNSKEGIPAGRIRTPEHTKALSEAFKIAKIGNQNSLGQPGPIDIDSPAGTKLKWFHSPDLTNQKMILCNAENKPIKEIYKDWILGKMHKNPHVQRRKDEHHEATNSTKEST